MKNISPQITKKVLSEYKFKDTKLVYEHLEYLGYDVKPKEDTDSDVANLSGTFKTTITLTIHPELMQFYSSYGDYKFDALKDVAVFKAINQINRSTVHTMWFITQENEQTGFIVGIYATYRCYDRTSFGNFITAYEQEIRTNLPAIAGYIAS